jgi:hypothetical protein
MPESQVHSTLVSLLLRFLNERHGGNLGLCVFCDAAASQREDKPRPINGFVPDVLALTVPASFTIIGEAKLHRDLDTPHSRSQLRAFLRFLRYSPDPHLMLAVPVAAHASAYGLMQRLQWDEGAANVDVEIVTSAVRRGQ